MTLLSFHCLTKSYVEQRHEEWQNIIVNTSVQSHSHSLYLMNHCLFCPIEIEFTKFNQNVKLINILPMASFQLHFVILVRRDNQS